MRVAQETRRRHQCQMNRRPRSRQLLEGPGFQRGKQHSPRRCGHHPRRRPRHIPPAARSSLVLIGTLSPGCRLSLATSSRAASRPCAGGSPDTRRNSARRVRGSVSKLVRPKLSNKTRQTILELPRFGFSLPPSSATRYFSSPLPCCRALAVIFVVLQNIKNYSAKLALCVRHPVPISLTATAPAAWRFSSHRGSCRLSADDRVSWVALQWHPIRNLWGQAPVSFDSKGPETNNTVPAARSPSPPTPAAHFTRRPPAIQSGIRGHPPFVVRSAP